MKPDELRFIRKYLAEQCEVRLNARAPRKDLRAHNETLYLYKVKFLLVLKPGVGTYCKYVPLHLVQQS